MSSMQSVQFGVGHRVKMPCALGDKPCALTPSTRASTVQPRCGTCSSASSRIALRNTSEMRQHAAIMPAQHHFFNRTSRPDTRLRTHPPAQCAIPRVPVLPLLLLAVAAVAEGTARSRPCDAGELRRRGTTAHTRHSPTCRPDRDCRRLRVRCDRQCAPDPYHHGM
jgi:hypothetical protein